MKIQLSTHAKQETAILEKGMEAINRVSKTALQWNRHSLYDYYETECDISEEEILPVFEELLKHYPALHIYATYSYDIREEDHSAQWWRTVEIQTEHHPDGTATLQFDSSTHWF